MGRRGLKPGRAGLWAGALALFVAGCSGRPPAIPQVVAPAAPDGFQLTTYQAAGVRLAAPRSWTTTQEQPPLVTVISSDGAFISLWRYARTSAPPSTHAQLQRTYRLLVAGARRRQPSLHVISAGLRSVDGHPSVELQATERNGRTPERVRSIHVFLPAAELVLDEYAPPKVFDRVNRQVFERVSRSLVVRGA